MDSGQRICILVRQLIHEQLIEYILLILAWLLFGIFHSVLAALWFKNMIMRASGSLFKYYRLFYSLFSILCLGVVLVYQDSIQPVYLWVRSVWDSICAYVMVVPGLLIMAASIQKYVTSVYGLKILVNRVDLPLLETRGLHSMVRHPLYLGTLMTIWALFLLFPTLANLIACGTITFYTLIGIRFEERKLLIQFGSAYVDYKDRVPMLIPFTKGFQLARIRKNLGNPQ